MHLITNDTEKIIDISAYIDYCKKQPNGINISCEKEEADSIYSRNTDAFYPTTIYKAFEVDGIPSGVPLEQYEKTIQDVAELKKDTATLAQAIVNKEIQDKLNQIGG